MRHQILVTLLGAATLLAVTTTASARDIVHDAEHYVLLKQYKDQWAAQDREIEAKLEALREEHGKPPNIIHILWDDTPLGEIGIPEIQKVRGWETPALNDIARNGINFMRMYTEPSCTPRCSAKWATPPASSASPTWATSNRAT